MKNLQVELDVSSVVSGTYPATPVGSNVAALPFENIYGFSAVITSLAGQTGTLTFQCSNDSPQTLQQFPASANWGTVPGGSLAIAGAAIQVGNFDALYFRWIRVSFTRTGGAGIILVKMSLKGV